MRTFVISDIHGNNESFKKALKHIELKKTDTLVLLGDLIDKGYDSKGVLDTIFLLQENKFNLICIKGNHEEMLIEAFHDYSKLNNWLLNGGKETLLSFLTSSIEKIPTKYIDLIKSFKYYHQIDNFIFVHAALNMLIKNPFEDINSMLWSREQEKLLNEKWLSGRVIIHGHSPTDKEDIIMSIKNKKEIICIDNGSFMKRLGYGSICVLQLENFNLNFIK